MATSSTKIMGVSHLAHMKSTPLERQAATTPLNSQLSGPPVQLRAPWPSLVLPSKPAHLTPPLRCFADVSQPIKKGGSRSASKVKAVATASPPAVQGSVSKCPFKKLLDRFGLSSDDPQARSQCPFLNQQKEEANASDDFVGELRRVSMSYHSEEFGGALPMPEKPFATWRPSLPAYLQFLADQHVMHEALERGTYLSDQHIPLRSTGLERAARLPADRAWFRSQGFELPPPDARARAYAQYLLEIAVTCPPAFTCHWYNINYAQAHGGRMLGKKCATWFFKGHELQMFKYEQEMSKLLGATKITLNRIAEAWSSEERQQCLDETPETFDRAWEMLNLVAE